MLPRFLGAKGFWVCLRHRNFSWDVVPQNSEVLGCFFLEFFPVLSSNSRFVTFASFPCFFVYNEAIDTRLAIGIGFSVIFNKNQELDFNLEDR